MITCTDVKPREYKAWYHDGTDECAIRIFNELNSLLYIPDLRLVKSTYKNNALRIEMTMYGKYVYLDCYLYLVYLGNGEFEAIREDQFKQRFKEVS